jgi:hypothetical protein
MIMLSSLVCTGLGCFISSELRDSPEFYGAIGSIVGGIASIAAAFITIRSLEYSKFVLRRTEAREYQMNKPQLALQGIQQSAIWNQGSCTGHKVVYSLANTGRYETEVSCRLCVWYTSSGYKCLDEKQQLPYPLAPEEKVVVDFSWESQGDQEYHLLLLIEYHDKIGKIIFDKRIWQIYKPAPKELISSVSIATVNEVNKFPKYEY